MVVFASDDSHTVGRLALKLTLSGPVVSRAIDALVALGYLRRLSDPDDGRSSMIRHTTAGAAFLGLFEVAIASAGRHRGAAYRRSHNALTATP